MEEPDAATTAGGAIVRPYDAERDREQLWALKRAFELELAAGTDEEDKRVAYEEKLTDAYRQRYLAWVERCVDDDPRCVTVAVRPGRDGKRQADDDTDHLAGYVFALPERLAMIWDAAVLNEIYVVPDWRASGVGDALLDAAVGLAREQDLPLDRLVLDVDPDNGRARAFYDRHGFEPWGELVARPL